MRLHAFVPGQHAAQSGTDRPAESLTICPRYENEIPLPIRLSIRKAGPGYVRCHGCARSRASTCNWHGGIGRPILADFGSHRSLMTDSRSSVKMQARPLSYSEAASAGRGQATDSFSGPCSRGSQRWSDNHVKSPRPEKGRFLAISES